MRTAPMVHPGDLFGDYEILSLLGTGGMGAVYLARDARLDRQVALKVLPESLTTDAKRVARFEREARTASGLNHPNICTIHAFGETSRGERFIVMERVEGVTLRALLDRRRLPLQTALDYAIQVAAGVQAAHGCGVVHRDLKPENVIVRPDGLLKILDFGLAKLVSEVAGDPDSGTRSVFETTAGQVVGTVHYMSPEQARGQHVDERTDIWSIGVLIFEMVAGTLPFTGSTASDVIASVLGHEPAPLGGFGADVPGATVRVGPDAVGLGARTPGSLLTADVPVVAVSGIAAVLVLAAGLTWWMGRATPQATGSQATSEPTLKRLTFDAGLQTDPSLSPDGRFVVYASDRSGNFDLWVKPIDGGDAVQITRDPEAAVQPAWSPDGQSVAFRSERQGGGIFVMPALGGHARQLSTFGTHPRWLSGSEILFVVGNVDAGGGALGAQVFVASADGEGPHEILRDFLSDAGLYWAAGHPDGRISLFAWHRRLGIGLFTLSRDGRSVTKSRIPASFPLHPQFLESMPTRFHWNGAGTALYLEATLGGIQNLWRITVAPQSLDWLHVERLTTGPGRDTGASLSADGRRLAYSSITEQTRVDVLSLDPEGRTVTGAPVTVTEPNAEVFGSALSHDGHRLAYVIRRAGTQTYELRVADIETGQSTLLDDDLHAGVHLAWTPDDSAVLHQRVRTVGPQSTAAQAQLVRHEPGGRETILLPWSADAFLVGDGTAGRNLIGSAFHFSGAPSEIVLRATVGGTLGEPRVLLADPHANLWEATYAPRQRWITFVREPLDDAHRVDLMIAPAEGAPPSRWTPIAPDHTWADKPRWSADGRLLYFLDRGTGSYANVWSVPFDVVRGTPAGAPFAVTHYRSPTLFVSPNLEKTSMGMANRRLALTITSATGSVWMLDNLPTDEGATTSR